jgi:hypothetical protein
MRTSILEFIKENQDLVFNKLNKKGFLLEKDDIEQAIKRETFSPQLNNPNKVYIESRKELKNHTLPFRWVGMDFSFSKKKHELEINGETIYYSYCIL